MREKLTANCLAAINEIEELIQTIRPENLVNRPHYFYDSERSECIQSTAEEVLTALNILKSRI